LHQLNFLKKWVKLRAPARARLGGYARGLMQQFPQQITFLLL